MKQYIDLVKRCLTEGIESDDRTGVGTISIFGHQSVYDVGASFPMLQLKKLYVAAIVHELLWFLKGETNIEYLKNHGVNIWNDWADQYGELGPIYGNQWRSWKTNDGRSIDQIEQVIQSIKTNPTSRRHIVSAWNVGDIDKMALPPCHLLFQFYVDKVNHTLSLQLYQRSADIFLGVPFNIASYSLLLCMVAKLTGYKVGKFIHTYGDAHIYKNHLAAVKQMLVNDVDDLINKRKDEEVVLELPDDVTKITDFTIDNINFVNYRPYHGVIKAPIAV